MQAYRDEESAWLKPVLLAVAHNYRTVASAADAPNAAAGRACNALEACGSQLQKYFSLAMGRTGAPGSSALGACLQRGPGCMAAFPPLQVERSLAGWEEPCRPRMAAVASGTLPDLLACPPAAHRLLSGVEVLHVCPI